MSASIGRPARQPPSLPYLTASLQSLDFGAKRAHHWNLLRAHLEKPKHAATANLQMGARIEAGQRRACPDRSDSFSLLTPLQGHQKVITGIALPSGSDKLYSGSKDETVRVWDCQSGQCVGVVSMGSEVGCMISEGPWIFIGVTNC
ncbi:uncharacterized protein A4U43_C01F36280 [Asparagus officinalis]|uniref:Uncharacterized protein n=1 Tax=Asparagus officinalis TaxID=4686 RepID=A0A5P1FUW7_ASPOF|nr:uncharacterized protein A4U43_C01F36280 [Asparagus officinalis]